MALPGELLGTEGIKCPDCEAELPLQVCRSAAGSYLGYFCDRDGPISRESGYFKNDNLAEKALENLSKASLRTTEFKR